MQAATRISAAFAYGQHLKRLTSTGRSRWAALDLLRLVSTTWIIIIHTYNFALAWLDFQPATSNRPEAGLLYQFIANGTFVVDNFFLLSGYLARVNLERVAPAAAGARRRSPVELLKPAWHRYARLAPLMMFLILLSVALSNQIDCASPNWSKATKMFDQWCSSNGGWLVNLFMAHNLIGTETMCFSHSWYLAAEFQLFVAFQLACHLFKSTTAAAASRKQFNLCCALAILLAQSISSLTVYHLDLPPMPLLPTRDSRAMNQYYKMLYIKPHYWVASYLVGVLLAHNRQQIKRARVERAQMIVACNLMLASALILSNLFFFRNDTPMSRELASLYALLARPLWSLNVACLLVMCQQVGRKPLLPRGPLACLSRLSFAAYLLHPVLMAAFYGSRAERFHFSHYLLIYFTIGNVCLTYLGATLLHILIELPCQILLTIEEYKSAANGRKRRGTAGATLGLRTIETRNGDELQAEGRVCCGQ